MASKAEANHSPFMNLPRELRDRIYDRYFEADAPEEVALSKAKDYIPDPAITLVSRQIHVETLELLGQTRRAFWEYRKLVAHIDTGCCGSVDASMAAMTLETAHALRAQPIKCLVVRTTFPWSDAFTDIEVSVDHRQGIQFDVRTQRGGLECSVDIEWPGWREYAAKYSVEQGVRLTSLEHAGCVDGYEVCKMWQKAFPDGGFVL